MIQTCHSLDDFKQLISESEDQPVVLFKHSTRCPVSAMANAEVEDFAAANPRISCWLNWVVEDRALSRQIADITGIIHESPQVLIFHQGKVVWDISHSSITEDALMEAIGSMMTRF
jgi:bacillithiol system protein YtxJ